MEVTAAALSKEALGAASKGDIGTIQSVSQQMDMGKCVDRHGATPVHYAARAGQVGCLRHLVQELGLSATKQTNNGATPCHDAAAMGKLDCLQWLVQHGGCSPEIRDSSGATPLHLAARFDHLSSVIWLVESEGCNPTERAKNGITPLHLAAARGSINVIRWLSQHDPSTVNKRADNGATPVYFAAQEGHLNCLQFLIQQVDGNCRLRASDGMAPVHAAAQMGKLDCLAWMIEHCKVSPLERDNDGATPVHFAAGRGHIQVLRWLLTHGARIEEDDLGGTPLHDAAEQGQLEAVKLLVSMGACVNAKDKDDLTPADLAKESGFVDCMKYLRTSELTFRTIETDLTKEHSMAPIIQSAIEANTPKSHTQSQQLGHSLSSGNIVPLTAPMPERVSSGQMVKSVTTSVLSAKVQNQTTAAPPTQARNELHEKFKLIKKQVHPAFQLSADRGQSRLQESSDDDKSNGDDEDGEGEEEIRTRKHNPELMMEVQTFDSAVLEKIPLVKRNLQPFKFGHVLDDTGRAKHSPSLLQRRQPNGDSSISYSQKLSQNRMVSAPSTKITLQQTEYQQNNSDQQNSSEDDTDYANMPVWKRNLMKKRAKEQMENSQDTNEEKWMDVPAWKRAILMKREAERTKKQAEELEKKRLEDEKRAKFEALPRWKQDLLTKKSHQPNEVTTS